MKGYFGGKEVLKVLLGSSVIYSKEEDVVLLPPETIIVPKSSYLSGFISYSTNPPTEDYTYNKSTRMTDWVTVRPNTSYKITNTYLTNTCVIQFKDDLGNITNFTQPEGVTMVDNLVFPTGNNTFVRIYFYVGANYGLVKDMSLTEQRG